MERSMNTIDWLARHALSTPDRTALVEVASGTRLTYADLNGSVSRAAGFLEARGIQPGDRVAVLSSNCAEMVYALFACQKLGAIFMPLNFRLPLMELGPILAESEPALLLYHPEFLDLAQQINVPAVDIHRLCDAAPYRRFLPVDWNETQMILYTSGTTGTPKGAMLSHRMNLWNAINVAVRDLQTSDVALVHSPLYSTGGLNVALLPMLFLGGQVVLMKRWDPEEVFQIIEQEKVTALFAVPTQILMMTQSPKWQTADLSSLRYIVSGGAPMPMHVAEAVLDRGVPYRQGFGMTEVGANCFALEARDARRKPGSIGFPSFSIEARIVGEDGMDVQTGTVGELVLRTPAMIDGYWNNPQATEQALRDGWFYTGDLARQDQDGYYFIVGRKKDMFISAGEKVYPAEIENALATNPKIARVAVTGVPHPLWGEVGCAAIVVKPGESLTEQDVQFFLRPRLARFKLPQMVLFLPELPRTPAGTIQKLEIRRMALEKIPS
jgi:fatty-acyl-CoA synthase